MSVTSNFADHASTSNGTQRRARVGTRAAMITLALSVVVLWILPPLGVAVAVAAGCVFAPWGRRLGERVIITVTVSGAVIAIIFTATALTSTSLAPLGWRGLITVALIVEAVCLRLPRSAPVLPLVRADDAIGAVTGTVFALLIYGPYALASTPRTITGLLTWWARGELPHDHSSHLPMFTQVMHAGGWNFSALSPDVLFTVFPSISPGVWSYPMLHTAIWSVGEWASGASTATPGLDLVRPYAAWAAGTAALAAAIFAWSAALAARAITHRAPRSVTSTAAALAAFVTGAWCITGSLASWFDFAASSFLIAVAVAVGAATVSTRNRTAMIRVGWFLTPLAAVMCAYLYPTVAPALVLPALVVLTAAWKFRRSRVWLMLLVSAACAAAVMPALRAIVGDQRQSAWGSITGGLPAFEYWPGVALSVVAFVGMVAIRPSIGRRVTIGLLGPLAAFSAFTAAFAVQSLLTHVNVGDSYYTNKMVFAMLLAALPLVSALLGSWAASRLPQESGSRRTVWLVGVVAVALIAVLEVSLITTRPGVGGGLLRSPAGLAALNARIEATTRTPLVGDVVVTTAENPSADGFTTITWIPVEKSVTGIRGEYVNLWTGRTANALSHVADTAFEGVNVPFEMILRAEDPVASLDSFLSQVAEVKVNLVVPDDETAQSLASVVAKYGSSRIRVIVAPASQ